MDLGLAVSAVLVASSASFARHPGASRAPVPFACTGRARMDSPPSRAREAGAQLETPVGRFGGGVRAV
jgi:hypothetical protein